MKLNSRISCSLAATAAGFALYTSSLYSYLLFHSLAETFSIVIAFGIFVIAWHSRRLIANSYLIFIGISFLFTGILDLVHMLAYKGMGVFIGHDANLPTQLWIAARYMQAVSFLLAPLLAVRKLNPEHVFASYVLVTAALLYSILGAQVFPVCYIEGTGLTSFKKISEYVISLLFAAGAVLLVRKRALFEQSILRFLILAVITTIFSELAFTFYVGVYDLSNLTGHILKIVAFYLIYRALIRTGLEQPQDLIFRELKLSEEALARQVEERTAALTRSTEQLTGIFERITDAFVALDTDWRYTYVNKKAAETFGRKPEDLVGRHIWTEFPEGIDQPFYKAYHRAMREQAPVFLEEYYPPYDRWFENRIYPSKDGLSIYFTDITERKKMEIALRESGQYNRALFERSVIGLALCRLDGSLVDVNEAYAKILGRTVDETLKLTYWDITPDTYAEQEARQLEALRTTGGYGPYEKEYIHKDGHLVPVRLQGLFIERGGERYIWSSVEDITERRKTEGALRGSEERYRDLYEKNPLMLFTVDPAGTVLSVNTMGAEQLGYTVEELVGRPVLTVFLEDDKQAALDHLAECVQHPGRIFHWELRQVRKDGGMIWVQESSYTIQDDRGGILVLIVCEDITERKQAEAKLRESEDKFRHVFEAANVGKSITSLTGEVSVNKAFADLLGYTQEELRNKIWRELTPPEEVGAVQEKLAPLISGDRDSARFEKRYVHKNGSYVWADVSVAMRRDSDRKPLHFITTVVDITEHKRAEEALRESEKRFESAFHTSPAAITITRIADGRFVDVNQAFLDLFEFGRDEVIGRTSTELGILRSEERTPLIQAQLKSGGLHNAELLTRAKSGRPLYLLFSSKPMTLSGEPHHVTTLIDITERKRAEATLRESEERLRLFAEQTPAPIAMLDENMNYIATSKRWLSEHYREDRTLIGRNMYEVFPDIPERWKEIHRRCLSGAVESSEADPWVRADGSTDWVRWEMRPWRKRDGAIGGLVVFSEDITANKKAEEELRMTNEELSAINRIITTTTTGGKEILERVLDEALNITGLEGGTICMVTPGNTLHLAAHRETSEATIYDLTANEIKIEDCLCCECARDWKPLILRDREAVLRYSTREAQRGEDIRFHAAFPLVAGKTCLGVLCVFTRTDNKASERSLKLLETATAQIALAIENARLYEDATRHAAILEQKVKERTAELEASVAEMERMNKLFVGRELRIIEMKEKVMEMEKEAEKLRR